MKNYLFFLIFILSSCHHSTKINSTNSKVKIISLEKTACFGTCPVFHIEIYNNGFATYNGKKFVTIKGLHNLEISKNDISKILKKAKEIDFQNLKNEYTENITDLPTTYIMVKNKKIKDYFGAPEKLKELEKMIEDIILNKLEITSF